MAGSIVSELKRVSSIPASKWSGVLLEAVEVYMDLNNMSREDYIKELADLCEQSVSNRFQDLLGFEVSDS